MLSEAVSQIAHHFHGFADACRDSTRLYEQLSRAIAEDPELIQVLMVEGGERISNQPLPNILFGAVNDLRGDTPYPGLASPEDPYPAFRAFCMARVDYIRPYFHTRTVQTNEVRRCTLWLPAFSVAAERTGSRPLALLEVGASAGLNLLWDKYGYHYSDGMKRGDLNAPLQLECEIRGKPLPVPETLPRIASRTGIDLYPVDVSDYDAVRWVEALVWVEQPERLERLRQAVSIAREQPPPIIQGNALEMLPEVVMKIPADSPLCLYHSFTINQFSQEMRDQFTQLIAAEAQQREHLVRLSIEWLSATGPELRMMHYHNSILVEDALLANVDHHGRWIEWL
jgi:hypothetical protein